MIRQVDAFTSPTLKHLRDSWWDDAFTEFVRETLQPRPGRRILDVGCGRGTAEVNLSRLRLTQVDLFGVDLLVDRLREAIAATRGHNMTAHFAAADACYLPFADAAFDSVFCVAVLQHIGDVTRAVVEMARITRPEGRVVAVEPDNGARYFYSSVPEGAQAHDSSVRFFTALAASRGDSAEASVGPRLASLFSECGIEPIGIQVFPVSSSTLGVPAPEVWEARRAAILSEVERARDESIRRLGHDHLQALQRYAAAAGNAGPAFVEIQNALLFAAVGQKASHG